MWRTDYKFAAATVFLLIAATAASAAALSRSGSNKLADETTEEPSVVSYDSLSGIEAEVITSSDPVQSDNEKKCRLTLLLSVSDHSLRMIVADEVGDPVKGQEFHVFLSDGTDTYEYADTDRDGILYAQGLPSGKYMAGLDDAEGYEIPDATSVRIREKMTYASLTNISELIRTEADVDAEKEDTANIEESDDGSLLEEGGIDLSSGTIGIDVSKYNKDIDWKAVKAAGIEYAIIRLGYRGSSTGALVKDPYFDQNYREARAAGVKVGIYFFTQALNEVEAEEEAEMVASLTKPEELSTPVFIDVESSGGRADPLDRTTRTNNIKKFCETIETLGYRAGVYANKKWFTKYIDTDELSDYKIWLAQYKVRTPTWDGHYDAWQYSSKGSVEGITGNVDLNLNLSLDD